MVNFQVPLVEGVFIQRLNRFVALVEIGGIQERVHVPNSGRMKELLVMGSQVWLAPAAGKKRLTAYTLLLVKYDNLLVSVDSHLANQLLFTWLTEGLLPELAGYQSFKREVNYGASRLDFFLACEREGCFVEVKSVTLVEEGEACFPDAPTERGSRHLAELTRAASEGLRAVVVFVVQREDAESFRPNDQMDPRFGQALRQAVKAGVEAYAYTCWVGLSGVSLNKRIPVVLD